jgi:hypothetical protein
VRCSAASPAAAPPKPESKRRVLHALPANGVLAEVRRDDDVIRAIQPFALVAVADHGGAAIALQACHPLGRMLTGDQASLGVARHAVRLIRARRKEGHPLPGRPLHPHALPDVAEKKIAALLPPDWPWPAIPAPSAPTPAIERHEALTRCSSF